MGLRRRTLYAVAAGTISMAAVAAADDAGQAPATATAAPVAPVAAALFVPEADREDKADLSVKTPTPQEIVNGLFPEESEAPEKRAERERCERLIKAGFKCMPPARSYTRWLLSFANFDVGSAALPDAAKVELRNFAEALRGRKSGAPVVRIEGHADASGTTAVNDRLSILRAETVVDYLVSMGVDRRLLLPQGYGAKALRNPSNPNAAENRRVEIARNLAP